MQEGRMKLMMDILKYAIGGIGLIACLWMLFSSGNYDLEVEEEKNNFMNSGSMSMAMLFTVGIVIAALVGVLLFFVYQLITNTKKTVMSIVGIIVALIVFLILYMIGTSDTNESLQLAEENFVEPGTLASSTAGLYTVLLGIIVAVLVALVGPFVMGKYRK